MKISGWMGAAGGATGGRFVDDTRSAARATVAGTNGNRMEPAGDIRLFKSSQKIRRANCSGIARKLHWNCWFETGLWNCFEEWPR